MLYFPNDQRGATIYAEEWNENTGLWGIGKEIANKDGIQARWSGWANALKAGGTWAPGQDMALRLLNPSLMVPRSISMSAHASLSCYGGCTKPRRVNNKPARPSISSINDLALICPRAGENHWTPIMLHFRTSTVPHSSDLRIWHTRTSQNGIHVCMPSFHSGMSYPYWILPACSLRQSRYYECHSTWGMITILIWWMRVWNDWRIQGNLGLQSLKSWILLYTFQENFGLLFIQCSIILDSFSSIILDP